MGSICQNVIPHSAASAGAPDVGGVVTVITDLAAGGQLREWHPEVTRFGHALEIEFVHG